MNIVFSDGESAAAVRDGLLLLYGLARRTSNRKILWSRFQPAPPSTGKLKGWQLVLDVSLSPQTSAAFWWAVVTQS